MPHACYWKTVIPCIPVSFLPAQLDLSKMAQRFGNLRCRFGNLWKSCEHYRKSFVKFASLWNIFRTVWKLLHFLEI